MFKLFRKKRNQKMNCRVMNATITCEEFERLEHRTELDCKLLGNDALGNEIRAKHRKCVEIRDEIRSLGRGKTREEINQMNNEYLINITQMRVVVRMAENRGLFVGNWVYMNL